MCVKKCKMKKSVKKEVKRLFIYNLIILECMHVLVFLIKVEVSVLFYFNCITKAISMVSHLSFHFVSSGLESGFRSSGSGQTETDQEGGSGDGGSSKCSRQGFNIFSVCLI